ncbi:hypothetical protein MGG_15766 [Pyricularia oryzae 70-15]|uniref:Uncharacterized protein n=3 Tax=Pyricularia oryzae TaxID=318829 RepID=G4MVS2_PYRO7|nr:uncharacterized protein MGG_15766 [Pyricularia oryzae 70-15]EHA54988.1 hypothetical protein MGG_15766 [Pyricularia oryzae 70-15]ELQ37693.1 hypothetical protein OOU_Y34scaffold00584g26 [Pyricularia oryzae Y34]
MAHGLGRMFTMRGSFDFMALTGSDEKPWADASEGRTSLHIVHGGRQATNVQLSLQQSPPEFR